MVTITKNELMKMGARSRLVEIETERLQILKLFPDLDLTTVEPAAPKKKRAAKKASARKRLGLPEGRMKDIALMVSKRETISPADVAKKLDVSASNAHKMLSEAANQGIVKRAGRGVYGRAS